MSLMSSADSFGATQCNIEAITISDHAPVTLKLKTGTNPTFKYWRANVSILKDEAIQQKLRTVLIEYLKFNDNNSVSPSVLWEGATGVLRGNIIAISSKLKKVRLVQQQELETKIKTLEKEYQQVKSNNTLSLLKENR